MVAQILALPARRGYSLVVGSPGRGGWTALVPRDRVQGLVAGVENPWKGKMLKSPPIGHFSEFLRRAHNVSPNTPASALNVNPLPASGRLAGLVATGPVIDGQALDRPIRASVLRVRAEWRRKGGAASGASRSMRVADRSR